VCCIVLERTVCVSYIKLGTLQVHESSKIVQSELQFEGCWGYLDGEGKKYKQEVQSDQENYTIFFSVG